MRLTGPRRRLHSGSAAHCARHALLHMAPKALNHWTTRAGWTADRKGVTSNYFTARYNARIASAVLATAIPSVCPSVCHMPVLCQTTARSTTQFASTVR